MSQWFISRVFSGGWVVCYLELLHQRQQKINNLPWHALPPVVTVTTTLLQYNDEQLQHLQQSITISISLLLLESHIMSTQTPHNIMITPTISNVPQHDGTRLTREMNAARRTRWPPTSGPSQSAWATSPPLGCSWPALTNPVIITQPKSWYSFYRPAEGGRLSRPRWLARHPMVYPPEDCHPSKY